MAIDGDLTTDHGVEILIAWHKEQSEFYERHERRAGTAQIKADYYRMKMRHLTTAELLAELLSLRG
jgi:hypothetical protein